MCWTTPKQNCSNLQTYFVIFLPGLIHTFIAPSLDFRDIVSRKDVSAVTMNMTGRVGLGLTPRYKIEMVKEYLSSTKPDILIVQDCIDCSDMVKSINLLQ